MSPPPASSPDTWHDQVILITGASSGIGQALACRLAPWGARLVLIGRRAEALALTDEAIQAAGGQPACLCPMDLVHATWDDYTQLHAKLEDTFGALHGLVLNAGQLGQFSPIAHYPPHLWHQVFQLNLHAPYLLCRALWPLLESSRASVVITTAPEGQAPQPYTGAYGLSKYALNGLVHMLHQETRHTDVRVNSVCPPPTRTPLHLQGYPAHPPDVHAPCDVTAPFVHLLSPRGAGMRGVTLSPATPEWHHIMSQPT